MKDKEAYYIGTGPDDYKIVYEEDMRNYWKNKTQWIDSELKLQEECTEEEYYRQQDSIREIMELNMIMYGKW